MRLKSKEWFFKHCLIQVRDSTPFADLSWGLLWKGVGQEDATRGHVAQAIGGVQRFLNQFATHLNTIRAADSDRPFNLGANNAMLQDWCNWFAAECARLASKRGAYGPKAFNYNLRTLAGYLTPRYGGRVHGGGGGLDELKKVLRLLPEFWDEP